MIIWLRHGQSTWNAADRMQYDALHPELTDRGQAQAADAAAALSDRGIDAVWSSPAVRAQQTARILGETLALSVRTTSLLAERSMSEAGADVVDRVLRFVDSLDHDAVTLAVSHGDTIDLASRLLAGRPVGVIGNASWIETPLNVER